MNGKRISADERLDRERRHGLAILETNERNWGWHTPAGQVRWQRRVDFLRDALPDGRGSVLEIGAGTGTFTEALSQTFSALTAIDISQHLLDAAQLKAPLARLHCMDAHDLQFPPNSFNAVIGCSVLHHLDWSRAIRSFLRVLKPNGVMRFSEPNLLNPQIFLQKNIPALKRLAGDSPDEYAFTAGRIRRDLEESGYVDIGVQAYEFLHPSVPQRLIPLIARVENLLMKTPLRHIGGSLLITARKPS
jgi:SAM-dependent methyltransferase